jgi:hypothetical protein
MSTSGAALMTQTAFNLGTRTVLIEGVTTAVPRAVSYNAVVAAASIIIIGACILAEFQKSWLVTNTSPSDDAREYTVGGWDSNGDPRTLGYTPGWLTKPIPIHHIGDRNLTPINSFDDSAGRGDNPGVFMCRFYADQSAFRGASDISGSTLELAVKTYAENRSNKDAVPRVKCSNSCGTSQGNQQYKGASPIKGIMVASQPYADRIACLPPFPPEDYFDPAIGPAATVDSPDYYTNKAWTDGKDYTIPVYPFGDPGTRGGSFFQAPDSTSSSGQWYYQLVYDKTKFGGADTATDGMPTHIWNTTLLRKYFTDSKISEMRRYYCQIQFGKYIKAIKTVPNPITIAPRMTRRVQAA